MVGLCLHVCFFACALTPQSLSLQISWIIYWNISNPAFFLLLLFEAINLLTPDQEMYRNAARSLYLTKKEVFTAVISLLIGSQDITSLNTFVPMLGFCLFGTLWVKLLFYLSWDFLLRVNLVKFILNGTTWPVFFFCFVFLNFVLDLAITPFSHTIEVFTKCHFLFTFTSGFNS